MDGVDVGTAASVTRFWRDLAAERGRSLSANESEGHVFGRRASHTLDALFPDLGVAEREKVHASLELYEAALSYSEIPGAVRLVNELAAVGTPCALVTGANSRKADEVASQLCLQDSFAARVVADDVARGMPDPEGYLLAARKLEAPSDRCIVFEEAASGVRAAAEADSCCVGVGSTRREAVLRKAGASFVVPDLRSVGVRGVAKERYDGINAYLRMCAASRTVVLPLSLRFNPTEPSVTLGRAQ